MIQSDLIWVYYTFRFCLRFVIATILFTYGLTWGSCILKFVFIFIQEICIFYWVYDLMISLNCKSRIVLYYFYFFLPTKIDNVNILMHWPISSRWSTHKVCLLWKLSILLIISTYYSHVLFGYYIYEKNDRSHIVLYYRCQFTEVFPVIKVMIYF